MMVKFLDQGNNRSLWWGFELQSTDSDRLWVRQAWGCSIYRLQKASLCGNYNYQQNSNIELGYP